jgi:LacI family transcriptional regulator
MSDMAAQAQQSARSMVIGLIVPDITNPFFAQLAKSIEMEVASRGGMVMLANSHDDPGIELKQVRAMHDWPVTGVIVVAGSDASRSYSAELPIISLDRRYGTYPLVATDQRDGARKVVDGKLYVNYSRSVQRTWSRDVPGFISKANQNWPSLN